MALIRKGLISICSRAFISPLLPALLIGAWLNLPSYAEDGLVYPDTAGVEFTWQVNGDTVTVAILNPTADSLTHFFISDDTDSQAVLIDCLIDGISIDPLETDSEFGTVYPDKYTTRWIIDHLAHSVIMRYYSSAYGDYKMNWSAGHPYPIFGMMPGIGPPVDPRYVE